jgi:hypothetical protein
MESRPRRARLARRSASAYPRRHGTEPVWPAVGTSQTSDPRPRRPLLAMRRADPLGGRGNPRPRYPRCRGRPLRARSPRSSQMQYAAKRGANGRDPPEPTGGRSSQAAASLDRGDQTRRRRRSSLVSVGGPVGEPFGLTRHRRATWHRGPNGRDPRNHAGSPLPCGVPARPPARSKWAVLGSNQ